MTRRPAEKHRAARRRAWGSLAQRDGKWYARIRIDGRRTWRLLLTEEGDPCQRLEDAEPSIERLRLAVRRGEHVRRGIRPRLGPWLDEEYAALLRARLTPFCAQQAETYLCRFAAWLVQSCGDPPMADVSLPQVERFCAEFLEAGHRASYLRRFVNVLRKAWNDAIERGFAKTNPWQKAPIPRIEETHVPWVAPEDLARVLAALPAFERPFVTLIAETGMRPSEAEALVWDDVDLEREQLHVRKGKSRAAKRTIPLGLTAIAALRSIRRRKDGRVFTPRWTQSTLLRMQSVCRHLGLPKLTLRCLRHAYASHLVVAGTPPTVVAALLGHADGGALVLRLYGRWFPADAQARAVAALRAFRSRTEGADASSGPPCRPPRAGARADRATRSSAPSAP